VILLGPPGAGKTSLAEVVCRELSRPYDLATATSDWSTFETIGGYLPRPQEGGTSGPSEPLDFTPGIVIQAIEAGRWLVIDELNRADIDKAFGELFTLFGGTDPSIRLPYQKRQLDGSYLQVALGRASSSAGDQHVYPLPADWRLIATMNTFDKASLYQLSFAFMRRFAFIEVPIPAPTDYQAIIATAGAELASLDEQLRTSTVSALSSLFTSVGAETLNGLGLTIGPAIPLDVISYLTNRWTEDASAPDLVLEALEMFLFPQFEGQAEKHSEIAKAIANALGHSSLPDTSEQRLRTWTGFIP
jgi:MoxR-like ATPase